MNKTVIKNFAIWARRELIESVVKKAQLYGIETDNIKEDIDATIKGDILDQDEKNQRKTLVEKIKKDGFDETMEEVAYTWFNRFMAIRFMEVNGYLPSHIRVFSAEDGSFNPQILQECVSLELDGLDKSKVIELYNAANKDKLFQYLFITQCNDLAKILPGMFEKISNYTELLLPDGLLKDDSVIKAMVEDIPEKDWKEQVQIIGWMYQYYNDERKDLVINIYKGNVAEKDIPAATQLFTTDWVVRYIVDNSLGRYWIERHPNSDLKNKLEFFVMPKNGEIEYIDEAVDPRNLRILDNCVGSGHFPIYEFEVLIEIYKECGYREKEAAEYILKDNLYGLDIDERARQLAYFSLMMKARTYNRRILNKGIEPNIYAIPESNGLDKKELNNFGSSLSKVEQEKARKELSYLISAFEDGRNYGSILKIEKCDFELLRRFIENIDEGQMSIFTRDIDVFQKKIKNIINVAETMTQKYDVVATNPPYLNKLNPKLKNFVNDNYKEYRQDLFSVFIYHNFEYCKPNGYSGFMTPFVWMFIKSYEKLREYIIENKSITTLVQMEYSAFEEATVPICSFVLKNGKEKSKGLYFKLSEFKGGMEIQKEKVVEAMKNSDCGYFHETSEDNFKKIPGMPVAYWASEKLIETFEYDSIYSHSVSPSQNITGNNAKFVRKFWELENFKIGNKDNWIFYAKGGGYRKWWGNLVDVVNWRPKARKIYQYGDGKHASQIINKAYWYKKGITWGLITSANPSFRIMPKGATFDKGGSTIIVLEESYNYILGLLNSKIYFEIVKLLNPTLNFQVKDIRLIPLIVKEYSYVNALVEEILKLSKLDWDMHETSWDFVKSPLLANKQDGLIESAYEIYKDEVNVRFGKLKANEEDLNRIFIEIYGLEDELTPEVSDKDITIAKIFDDKKEIYDDIKGNKYVMTREDVIKNFLSYFIGCVMGRYSLDEDGLVFAGGEFDESRYKTFVADEDGIIPFTEEEYFADDIIVRLEKFLKVTFGEEHIKENLEFIALDLKGKSSDSSREKIRNYFMNDFYKVHFKMYRKCPIYWLCDSGKLGASRNLLYMHRYKKDSIARLRIRYIFEIQDRYKQALERINSVIDGASGNDRVNYQKKADRLKRLIIETEKYEEKVQHLADSYIEIDLDDGVKENHKKFKDILAKI